MSTGKNTGYTPQDLPGGRFDPPVPLSLVAQSIQQAAGTDKPGPDQVSGDHAAMRSAWHKVATIAGGTEAMREAGKKYLPKYNLEEDDDYKDRKDSTPFVNVYEDVVSSLCAKPFSREVQFENAEEVDQTFKDLYENIDGQGNNLHVFAERMFRDGVDNALDWILVDYTKLPPLPEGRTARTLAEEQALGARPYWVHVAAPSVLAVYSTMLRGNEVFTHIRVNEPTLVRDEYKETIKTRVRIYDRQPIENEDGSEDFAPATWTLVQRNVDAQGKVTWDLVDDGEVAIGIIPMVPFVPGKRSGNGWFVRPPMGTLLDMQIDAFQQESNLRNAELMAAFPMLTASGVAQPMATPAGAGIGGMPQGGPAPVKVRTGPRAVLWAPPTPGGGTPGSWSFIEPAATSLQYLKSRLESTYDRMADIGMQPLAESPQTVITSANVSVKANSALQAWALRAKDTLEQAMVITALWLGGTKEDAPGVDVYKDFGVDVQGAAELTVLESAAKDGKLSGQTFRAELKRRNVLADSFDETEEQERLANEAAAGVPDGGLGPDSAEGDIDPATGAALNDNGNEPVQEPVDPASFKDAGAIDDETLKRLFGA